MGLFSHILEILGFGSSAFIGSFIAFHYSPIIKSRYIVNSNEGDDSGILQDSNEEDDSGILQDHK
jgi:hypothetical protein